MKLNLKTGSTLALLCASILFSCKKDQVEFIPGPGKETLVLSGEITAPTTLDPNKDYVIRGRVFVKNNVDFRIPAGTVIQAAPSENGADKAALIITRGSTIFIDGTVDKPVVFTSAATNKAPGDWVGLIVLGKAQTNGVGNVLHIAGMEETPDTEFGGSENESNAGSIKYLRVEYAGGLNPANEEEWAIDYASGLMLGGVGSKTVLENVMVKHSNDDGFQFVGGSVGGRYLISYDNGDDNFDFDRGYTGNLQFIVSYRPNATKVGIRAHGVESLKDIDATNIKPYTHPVISNMTVVGPAEAQAEGDQSQGVYSRKNTRLSIQNSIIAGYTYGGFLLCTKTRPLLIENNITADNSEFRYNMVQADLTEWAFNYDTGPTGTAIVIDPELAAWATQTGTSTTKARVNNNQLLTDINAFQFGSLYQTGTAPDFRPQVGSPALSGAVFTQASFSKMERVTFIGAMATTHNWANSGNWANWD